MKKTDRCVYALALCIAGFIFGSSVQAQKFPERTVRIVVPFAVGTSPDITCRLIAEKLTIAWKQPVVVDNRPGAAGALAAMEVKRSRPDGHDWFIGDVGSLVINPMIARDLSFDAEKDFTPVTQLTKIYFYIWVSASSPIRTVAELIAQAKAQPDKLSFASNGSGSPQHLLWELLMQQANIRMLHVPFKGGAPAQTAVASGDVTGLVAGYNLGRPMMIAGKIRPLAVAAAKRDPQNPDVQTVEESGGPAGFESTPWTGVTVLTGTPRSTIDKIHADVVQTLRLPDVNEKLLRTGNFVVGTTPEEMAAQLRLEREHYRSVALGMKARGQN